MQLHGRISSAGLVLIALLASGVAARAQQDGDVTVIIKAKSKPAVLPTLLVMCDLACDWKLDGESKGHINAGKGAKVNVEPGQHMVEATTEDGADQVTEPSTVQPTGQTMVSIELWPIRYARLVAEQEARDEAAQAQVAKEQAEQGAREEAAVFWTDPATGLMWTKKDSGRDVSWQEAVDYCSNLQLAGHSDWRLPEIEELQGIYDSSINIPGHFSDGKPLNWHVKGNLKLSGIMEWSKTSGPQEPTTHSAAAWTFYFFSYAGMQEFLDWGKRSSFSFDYPYDGLRALCVRSNAEAMFALGQEYESGEGVPRNDTQAAAWYQKAADLGNAKAQFFLAVLYEEGRGVPKDGAKAIGWLRKSAEHGYVPAQDELGSSYQLGENAPQDYAQAAFWFRKAADQGDADAQSFLGDLYLNGNGVQRDAAQAVAWYRKAAEQGDAHSQLAMGELFSSGQGVQQDYAEAYYWIELSGLNTEIAVKTRDEAVSHLTPTLRLETQARVRKWFEDHTERPQ